MLVSDAAIAKVSKLLKEENNPNLKLRVYVTGGGCSGFQYGFKFDDQVNEDDTQIVNSEVTILVDSVSFEYLENSEIDYKETLTASQFVINNPDVKATCGCGSSFAV